MNPLQPVIEAVRPVGGEENEAVRAVGDSLKGSAHEALRCNDTWHNEIDGLVVARIQVVCLTTRGYQGSH